jgi:acyl carrier protein
VVEDDIRAVLADHGRLSVDVGALSGTDDLYRNGLTSHASVNLMLALEDKFEIEFPPQMLRKATFQSIDSIQAAIGELTAP